MQDLVVWTLSSDAINEVDIRYWVCLWGVVVWFLCRCGDVQRGEHYGAVSVGFGDVVFFAELIHDLCNSNAVVWEAAKTTIGEVKGVTSTAVVGNA